MIMYLSSGFKFIMRIVVLGIFMSALVWAPTGVASGGTEIFRWQRQQLFESLEREFEAARSMPASVIDNKFTKLERDGFRVIGKIKHSAEQIPFSSLEKLEAVQFRLAALAAARPELLQRVQLFINQARFVVLRVARNWPIDEWKVHAAVYRVIYGGRSAIEEALAQHQVSGAPALTLLENIPSSTPSVIVQGVRVHSGDIVLSRGGAPTSALIARGNTFPGNFSHAALVYVDPDTGKATVIESLIEKGAVLTTVEDYLNYKSLRLLLLRLRPGHPAIREDELVPHKAASAMMQRVKAGSIPYDFAMDWQDTSRFFCSEVPYHAYQSFGIDLWSYKSRLSSPGLISWLGDMGVEHFLTLIPSDLEYDPKLAPVAEWRNINTLAQDRFDNAILDALLERAEQGARLDYAWYKYPLAAVVKLWSVFQSGLGFRPVIPEGMTVATTLRVRELIHNIHPTIKKDIQESAAQFRKKKGYTAPYWVLLDLARESLNKHSHLLSRDAGFYRRSSAPLAP